MKNAVAHSAILILLAGSPAWAQGELVWSDEFNGTQLDPANWEYMIGNGEGGWGNGELQYYTARPENCYVADGMLHIIARAENPTYAGYPYTSARLRTQGRRDFRYGRFEGRIKLPSTTGIWPAFWMLPTNWVYGGWAASGEIDIIESVNTATTAYGTLHFGGNWPNNTSAGGIYEPGINFGSDFHVYAIEWDDSSIRWFVDDVNYLTLDSSAWYSDTVPEDPNAPFDQFFHFLLNVAVGGGFPGAPNGSSQFPQEMLVDWVRVYSLGGGPFQTPFLGGPMPIPGQVEAEDFDFGGEGLAYHDCDGVNQGGAYRPIGGVDIEASSEGGYNIGYMCPGEWLEYTVNVAAVGPYVLEARVASQGTGGDFQIHIDGFNVTGDMQVPVTGGWQAWTTISTVVILPAGERVLRFTNGSSTDEYNLNFFRFSNLSPADLNQDGTVSLADFGLFVDCLAGPQTGNVLPACSPTMFDRSDFDGDDDVDLDDFQRFNVIYE